MSTALDNKTLLQHVFSETAKGNGHPFLEALADDVSWTIIGTTAWSRTYVGKKAVMQELLGPLGAQMASRSVITASRFVAEGDTVVVEGQGHNTTKSGVPYRNQYCWLFRFRDGKVYNLTEYADTALIASALQPPALASSSSGR